MGVDENQNQQFANKSKLIHTGTLVRVVATHSVADFFLFVEKEATTHTKAYTAQKFFYLHT